MTSSLYVVAAIAAVYSVVTIVHGLRQNTRKARQIGLPYIVTPCSPYNRLWQITAALWVPLIQQLPGRLWQDWLFILLPDWGYQFLQEPFERLGDSFVVCSPSQLVLITQDPDGIHCISTRREQFPKATAYYKVLEVFGRNLLTTEGAVWRLHRKVTSTSFNERNAAHTFAEAIHQTQQMVHQWEAQKATITSIEADTMALALNIIGYVGFGLRFVWPHEELPPDTDPRQRKYSSLVPPPGHSMTFAVSVERVLHHILLLLLLPAGLLRQLSRLPLRAVREAREARDNYQQYMRELLAEKTAAVRAGDRGAGGMDLMGQLVRAREDTGKADGAGAGGLTDDEIVGNAFVMLVAGHETTANTMHFALLDLAAHPTAQRALQADIDRLLGRDSDPAQWSYDAVIGGLQASMLGAAMNETLRMMPPVVVVPKIVAGAAGAPDQVLTLNGRAHALPAGLDIMLSVVTAHRNPRYWPSRPSARGAPSDLDDYVPERWFRESAGGAAAAAPAAAAQSETPDDDSTPDDLGGYTGPDTSAQLFRPARGSFVPFSDGARSCLGRRIAQVEILAALAVLFQRYSLELAVDDWADDDAVAALSTAERRALYARAQDRERSVLRGATTMLTLKLHGTAAVPVRLVPRGSERFVHIVDV